MDKTLIPLFVSGTLLLLMLTAFIFIMIIVQKNKQMELIEKHEDDLVKACEIQHEQTLNKIAEELHDNIGQRLHLIRRQGGDIRKLASDKEQLEIITFCNDLMDEIIDNLDRIRETINGTMYEETDLIQSLKEEVAALDKLKGMSAKLNIVGHSEGIAEGITMNLVRIVKEALQNVLKHAGATKVEVNLLADESRLRISIVDNGRGFDTANQILQTSQEGIRNMKRRAALTASNLLIESQPNKGTKITTETPLLRKSNEYGF